MNRLQILDTRNRIRTDKTPSRSDPIQTRSRNIRTIYVFAREKELPAAKKTWLREKFPAGGRRDGTLAGVARRNLPFRASPLGRGRQRRFTVWPALNGRPYTSAAHPAIPARCSTRCLNAALRGHGGSTRDRDILGCQERRKATSTMIPVICARFITKITSGVNSDSTGASGYPPASHCHPGTAKIRATCLLRICASIHFVTTWQRQ